MTCPNPAVLELCRTRPSDLRPGQLVELVRCMGRLADWWLRPEVLERAGQELGQREVRRPSLPTAAGSCWIVFAQHQPPAWPALRDAFLLPLQWRRGTPDSPHLPFRLRQMARQVADAVRHSDWGLYPSAEAGLDAIDLSQIDELLEVASGWASLAAGLLVAAENGTPDPAVWATGAWSDHGGIRPVGHLEAKIRLAVEYQVRQLFVPASQVEDARRLAGQHPGSLSVDPLLEGEAQPATALGPYRNALDLPPLRQDPPDRRRNYYLRQRDEARARQFYRDNLLPDIAHNLREQWLRHNGSPATHLVTFASDNPELVYLAVQVVRPRTCLILYTRDKSDRLQEACQLLEQNPTDCEMIPREYESLEHLLQGISPAVRQFVAHLAPEGVVLDLTPGNKEMSLILALEVAQPGNRLYYVRHERRGPRVVPFSERLLVRRVGEGNGRRD